MELKHWDEVKIITDDAQNVTKLVFTKADAVAEAVLYRYPTYEERTVICCSTQSGCPVGCRFCGAGDSFVRSLTAAEIVEQVDYCMHLTGLKAEPKRSQIMFMSMGEPLLNLKALVIACYQLEALYPRAALLISTSAPDIGEGWTTLFMASANIPAIGLQFSLHESTDEARDVLIPFKKKLNLREIAAAGMGWHLATGRKPFFNYCAHDGNVSDADADRILALFTPNIFEATISVVCERNEGLPATNDHQRALAVGFSSKLLARGYNVRVFDPAGQDTLGGGCGQLWFVQSWMNEHPDLARPSVGRALPKVHAPGALSGILDHPEVAESEREPATVVSRA